MQAGVDIAKVAALTVAPNFIDLYGDDTKTYKPAGAGEIGYMTLANATTAATAGDVVLLAGADLRSVEAAIGGPLVGKGQGRPITPVVTTIAAAGVGVTVGTLPVTSPATVTVTVDAHGKALAANATATISYNIGAGAKQKVAQIAKNDQGPQIAQAISTALGAVTGLSASSTGSVVTVTPDNTVTLTVLTVTLA